MALFSKVFGGGKPLPAEGIYKDLREQALSFARIELEPELAAGDDPVVILMDHALDRKTGFTLATVKDGSLSLYFSNGGGIIGFGEWPALREAGLQQRKEMAALAPLLTEGCEQPMPCPKQVGFHFVYPGKILSAYALEKEVAQEGHALHALFNHCHELIAVLRQAQAMQEREPELIFAICMNAPDMVKQMLAEGTDPNCVSCNGLPALSEAVRFPHAEMVEALIKAGADVTVKVSDEAIQNSPLLNFAAALGEQRIAELLLDAGAAIGAQDDTGLAAMHTAASMDQSEMLGFLLDRGADIEQQEESGYSPLMMAANTGSARAARVLLERGAGVEAGDHQGSTSLMFAAQHGHDEIVTLLLERGADPHRCGEHGFSALTLTAQHEGREGTLALLTGG